MIPIIGNEIFHCILFTSCQLPLYNYFSVVVCFICSYFLCNLLKIVNYSSKYYSFIMWNNSFIMSIHCGHPRYVLPGEKLWFKGIYVLFLFRICKQKPDILFLWCSWSVKCVDLCNLNTFPEISPPNLQEFQSESLCNLLTEHMIFISAEFKLPSVCLYCLYGDNPCTTISLLNPFFLVKMTATPFPSAETKVLPEV